MKSFKGYPGNKRFSQHHPEANHVAEISTMSLKYQKTLATQEVIYGFAISEVKVKLTSQQGFFLSLVDTSWVSQGRDEYSWVGVRMWLVV